MNGTSSFGWRGRLLFASAVVGLVACTDDTRTPVREADVPRASVVAGLPPPSTVVAAAPQPGTTAPGVLIVDPANVRLQSGYAFWIALPDAWLRYASDHEDPQRSPLVVEEDGRPLAPANALLETVQKVGRGSFVHWGGWLYFSTSDNTDPRSNGREYRLVLTPAE